MLPLIAVIVGLLLVLFGIGLAGGLGAMWMHELVTRRERKRERERAHFNIWESEFDQL